jgi:hypothetical protein
LRSSARTAVLLAASSLAASFLGNEAFGGSGWDATAVIAAAAFLVTMLAAVYVLLPRKRFVFSLIGSAVYEQFYGLGQEEIHRRLAYDLDRFWEENDLYRGARSGRPRRGYNCVSMAVKDTTSSGSKPAPPPPPPPTPGIGSPETRAG